MKYTTHFIRVVWELEGLGCLSLFHLFKRCDNILIDLVSLPLPVQGHRCPQDPRGPGHEGPGQRVAELRGEEAPGVGAQAAAQPEVARPEQALDEKRLQSDNNGRKGQKVGK